MAEKRARSKGASSGARSHPPSAFKYWPAALVVIAVVAALAGARGWLRSPPAIEQGNCRGCNLLLITIDTLRTDRVGAFGGPAGLTSNLDRLAGHGIRFTRAYASAPLTLPSHTSILTAVPPPVHGVRTNGLFRLGPSLPTLATVLHDRGYRTGAFVGAFVLDARFGLNRGFDVYDDRYGEEHAPDEEGAERRAEDVIKPALAWIESAAPSPEHAAPSTERAAPSTEHAAPSTEHAAPSTQHPAPFFAWIHLYDPHEPYRAPEPYASQHAPYDAEVAYTDAMVGRLLDELRRRGLLDRTAVIVAADHGESLGEHGERTHGVFVYDVTMRVPWIISTPLSRRAKALAEPRAFDGLARLIDLAPTALDMLGVPAPPEFEGRSLLPAVNGRADPPATAYIEAMDANLTRNWAPLTGLVSGGFKLMDLPIPELYDLATDPREGTNLFAREGDRARVLGSLLKTETAAFAAREHGAEKTTLNTEARQRLQALGYVAASADPRQRTYTAADDPKTLIGPANALNEALAAFNRGDRAGGIARVREIMQAHPDFPTPAGIYASMQWQTGDRPGAIATLESLVRREIADQSVMVVLAGYLQDTGALEKAAALLQAVIAAHPDYVEAYNSLGVVYSRMGRHADAKQALAKVLDLDPTSAKAYENLGIDDFRAGELASAKTYLARALALDPALAGARNALAAVYMRGRQPDEAIEQWKKALEANPRAWDALYNIATVLYDRGQHDAARPYVERFVNGAPPAQYAPDIARLRALLR